jgi:hypothetical protein
LQKETKRRKFVNFSARLSEKKVVKVLLNIQGTAEETKNKHLKPQSSSKKQFKNLPENHRLLCTWINPLEKIIY